ncbi:MAG: dTDP-4-dehydrorhamnose 3,5-epimerase [Thermodesulfobacteriota bacterium]
MLFTETEIAGAYLIDPEPVTDDRGSFVRTFCKREFKEHGLVCTFVQGNISYNRKKGTVRGMHYQIRPHEEVKVVRCVRGTIFDVIVDLRPDSRTFKQWLGFELSGANQRSLYVPAGVAHGFQTLEDDSEVLYLMSQFYNPDAAAGVRWDDPAFGIKWPLEVTAISVKDREYPNFKA